jgi:uncharacterized damage-inducible protein DinB
VSEKKLPDAWLRGPIEGIPPLLLPAAHAFIGAAEDVARAAPDLPPEALWMKPGGAASAGFHLKHLVGSTDRLLGYARGEPLTDAKKARAAKEGVGDADETLESLTRAAHDALMAALDELRATPDERLLEPREAGAMRLPTTVLGAIFHAAEHAQRHAGQFVTTVKVVRGLGLAQ